jgi:CRP-like cAMP-binding protein
MTHRFEDFAQGTYIIKEGDIGSEMYIIDTGTVSVYRKASGPDALAVLGPGDFFGEMSILEDEARFASVRSDTPVRVLKVDRSGFLPMMRDNPEIMIRILRQMSQRVRRAEERLSDMRRQVGDKETAFEQPAVKSTAPLIGELPKPVRMLHVDSSTEFVLPRAFVELLIGRPDPVTNTHPDLNFAPIDPKRTLSRRHAKLLVRGGQLYAQEELGTANGTFVNGMQLRTGEPALVRVGDRLRFGLVELVVEAVPS